MVKCKILMKWRIKSYEMLDFDNLIVTIRISNPSNSILSTTEAVIFLTFKLHLIAVFFASWHLEN